MLSEDLALRHNANVLFDLIESLDEETVLIDFSGVRSITWSFVHEYVSRRGRSPKSVREINMPSIVRRMFEAVIAHQQAAPVRPV